MLKILVVEDDRELRHLFAHVLIKNGYSVKEVSNGKEALDAIEEEHYDLIISDIMMPKMDGYELVRSLRDAGNTTPILMITAKDAFDDMRMGFLSGTDDYMVKPFSPKELLARINALLRRISLADKQVEEESNAIHSGIFTILQDERKLLKNGQEIELTPIEFALVKYFMENPNKAIHRAEILNNVWGYNYVGDFKIVDVNIRRIRQKIEEDPSNPKYIEKVWGYGYRWWGGEE